VVTLAEWLDREKVPDEVRAIILGWGDRARHYKRRIYCNFADWRHLPPDAMIISWRDCWLDGRANYAWVLEHLHAGWARKSEKVIHREKEKREAYNGDNHS
jgi:hypothetical protein